MSKLLRVAILTCTAVVVLVIASPQLQAQSKWPNPAPNTSSGTASSSAAQTGGQKLYRSYFTQGDQVFLAEEGYQMLALDSPTTIACPITSGTCTLEIEQSASAGGVDSTGNWLATFAEVDGNLNPAPPAGETPTDLSYIHTGCTWSTTLTPGNHTVQSFIYSFYGLYVWSYHNTYRVHVPATAVIP